LLVVLSLALGTGANTALFSIARSMLFSPSPYREADRVVFVELSRKGLPIPATDAQAIAMRSAPSLERVEGYSTQRLDWRRTDSTLQVLARTVTPDLPTWMGMTTMAGRSFDAADGAPGAEAVAIVSEPFWRRELAAAPDAVGRTLMLAGTAHTVIGVGRPASNDWNVDLWLARAFSTKGEWRPALVAWLRDGTNREPVRAELSGIVAGTAAGPADVRLTGPGDGRFDSGFARMVLVFWGASALLLAIVCANLANLTMARNLAGAREIAIRAALGAARWRLAGLMVGEMLLLGFVGALAALLIATWGIAGVLALRPLSLSLVYPHDVPIDATIAGYAFAVALLTSPVVGAVPALGAARRNAASDLVRPDQDTSTSRSGGWVFRGAVGVQAALAVMLLTGAGLLVNSYARLLRVDPGFEADQVVQLTVLLTSPRYADAATRRDFFRRLEKHVQGLNGVSSAAAATDKPSYSLVLEAPIEIDGRPCDGLPPAEASWVHVTPQYLPVLGVPITAGRMPDREGATDEVIVSQSFARRYWPDGSVVGQRFRVQRATGWSAWFSIVGVAGDIKGRGLKDTIDEVYLPFSQATARSASIVARVSGEPTAFYDAIRAQLWALDPELPVASIGTLAESMARSIDEHPFYAGLLGLFAIAALVLAAIGVFGVAWYAASKRRREIGIRLAIGADARSVERMMLSREIRPALLGIAAGLGGSLLLARVLQKLLYGITVTDPATYLATTAVLTVVCVIGTWLPARRASRVDPSSLLRTE
jgi:putative ABC transport system permease protein